MSATVLTKVYLKTNQVPAVLEALRQMRHGRVHGGDIFEDFKNPHDGGDLHFLHWFAEIGMGGRRPGHLATEAAYGESVMMAIRSADPAARVIDMRIITTDHLDWYAWCSERGVWDSERNVWQAPPARVDESEGA